MDTLITVSIMALMLFAASGSARAATLLVSNQMQTRGNVPVFVTCHPIPKLSKPVPFGQKILIEIPASAGGNENAEAFRVLPHTKCIGTFYAKAHDAEPYEMWYDLYDSDKEYRKDSCVVVVKDDGFYRWNHSNIMWDKIPPKIWF